MQKYILIINNYKDIFFELFHLSYSTILEKLWKICEFQ